MRNAARKMIGVLVVGMLCSPSPWAADSLDSMAVSEPEIKAAMLYNFIKFVEWPSPQAAGPFVIGVHGSGSFATVLARTVGGRVVQGRAVVVRKVQSAAEIQTCHALFVAGTEAGRGMAAIEPARRSAVLTVGESPGFSRKGGIIGFVIVDNRTNFEINPDAAVRVGLKISSKLLRLATIVKEGE